MNRNTYRFALKDGTVLLGEISTTCSKFNDHFIEVKNPRLVTALVMKDVDFNFDLGLDPIFDGPSGNISDYFENFIQINRDYVMHIAKIK